MNSIRKNATAILVLAICTSAIDAQACGEALYRMGGALRYHAFVTRHPANIVLYRGPAAREHFSASGSGFRENLEKAGHKVTVVQGPQELAQALGAHPYDVVIAYAGDLDGVSDQIAKASREPTVIPVVDRDASNQRELRERFPRLVTDDANLNKFLQVIEQSMKARGA